MNVVSQPVLLPAITLLPTFHTFPERSNKICRLFSVTCTVFFALEKINHLFSHSSKKHGGVHTLRHKMCTILHVSGFAGLSLWLAPRGVAHHSPPSLKFFAICSYETGLFTSQKRRERVRYRGNVELSSRAVWRPRKRRNPMTVCIGALCDTKEIENTANIVLCADTLVTYTQEGTPITSNPNGSKIFPLPLGFRCAVADDLTQSHVFVSKLVEVMRDLELNDPSLHDQVKLAIEATNEYIRNWLRLRILGDFGVTLGEYLHDKDLVDREKIREEISTSRAPIEMIVAGFNGMRPILFYTDSVTIQEQPILGFYSAQDTRTFQSGGGADLALAWLNFREQMPFMSSQRTVYHILEAKRFAEQNPTVGKRSIVLFMAPGHTSMWDTNDGFPQVLQTWKAEFYVKTTEQLDDDRQHDVLFSLFTPLTSGK